ncbi:gluconokinase [Falsibacillus albus]|uniref:Gluconokinase n=1 Tax=Falsibacillus albus TaxID=2478915 RepID=A0A3L7K4B2_9BACI|nr:gluconokinase [Falsibacillus albus]RLQ95562.1 gluconokinase [Falsibacillus albus]
MIGVDIGTTSTKAVLFKKDGSALSRHAVEYPLLTPNPATAEQDPDEIFRAVLASIKGCIDETGIRPEDIEFVSFSAAMHSLILVDENGTPLTKSITWADNRSAAWAEKLKNGNGHDIYLRTGTPIHPMSPLVKILWLNEEHSELISKAAKYISIKEYVFYKLFGVYVVDHSIASATGMFNLNELDWDEGALALIDVTKDKLSEPVSTTYALEGLSEEHASLMGLTRRVPFIVGASDGVLSNLGVNAIDPGVVALTIGTSGAIRTVSDHPVTDPKGRIFCYALTENHWVIGGPVNNGGMIFRWAKNELAASEIETAKRLGVDPYDLLTEMADKVGPGSEGLLFHPYLAGERAPLWNADARGSFFGLGLHHKKEHMVRAVLEGIVMNLYTVLLALGELVGEPKQIQATGGFARSQVWRQLLADVFGHEVTVPESFESSCLGAVVLGMYGMGEIKDFSVVKEMVGSVHSHKPSSEAAEIYEELIPMFIRISRLLEQEYSEIAKFQHKYVTK